jgi:DnaK suppressor protein
MDKKRQARFREQLLEMARRLRGDIAGLEDQARSATGGEAGGNLSNTPMHLADLGTEVYMQELNATLLENEQYIGDEVVAALGRIERGTFGTCERCGRPIAEERLELLPYTRYCTPCAEAVQAGRPVNLNEGRPHDGSDTLNPHDDRDAPEPEDEFGPDDLAGPGDHADIHAAGTAGGGTAIGGLAGTNIGEGDPASADLENAMGSGNFDVALEAEQDDATPYSGPAGGAVGGTPAGKRAVGGKVHGGINPHEPGDSPTGP